MNQKEIDCQKNSQKYFKEQSINRMHYETNITSEPLWSNADFAQQNHGNFVLCPAKLWSNAGFALQNYGDIVSGDNKYHKI